MDTTKPVLFAGKLTKIEWQNPHVYIYLSVKDLSGAVKEFGFHAGAPNRLIQEGWTRDMLKIGDEITVRGFLTKNGTPRGGLTALIYKGTSFQVNAPNC
jgi:hypothetical protein